MLPQKPDQHMRVTASQILESIPRPLRSRRGRRNSLFLRRVSDRGIPRAVFFKGGWLVDYPANSTMTRNHMSRNGKGVVALGVYDDEATIEHILEDIGSMNQSDLWPSTSN